MKSNWTMFHVWGIPIRINISLIIVLPILAYLIGSGEQIAAYADIITALTPADVDPTLLDGPNDRWIIGISAAVGLFASVTFHELGHSWVAMRYDIEVESITLWLLGGLASLSEMPREWNREFWIAVAGPIASIFLGVVGLVALAFVPTSAVLVVFILGFLTVMNLILAGFNMLPAFPMDGGRVLRSLLARKRGYVRATRTAASVGTGFAIVFLVFGILAFSPLLILLALFIYVAASSESRAVVLGHLLEGLTVEDLLSEEEPIASDAPLSSLVDRLFRARRSELAVVDPDGTFRGVVTTDSIRGLSPEDYESQTVASLARTDHQRFDVAMSAFDALMELSKDRSEVAVVERDGRPVGVVSRADFTSAMDIRRDTEPF